jgi:uncharacterized glyoxalase superfamily protein PhnB
VIPQRLTLVTIGARHMHALRDFYCGWGWTPLEGDLDEIAFFELGGVKLAVWDAESLRDEAAPGSPIPPPGWNGITLAINLHTREEVDTVYDAALAAGATMITRPADRDWGGRSGYVADPEGTRWEIAWAEMFPPD